jgi:hypothetical protein
MQDERDSIQDYHGEQGKIFGAQLTYFSVNQIYASWTGLSG